MPCQPFKTEHGWGIACSRGRRSLGLCVECKAAAASQLCDFPVERAGRQTTCDRALCRRCATRLSGDRDLCRPHAALWDHENNRPKVGPEAGPA